MKLPEITQEILDEFADNFCDEEGPVVGGDGDPYNSQLIEWVDKKPQWTQTAVDFARLVTEGEAEKIADLESAGRALLEWDEHNPATYGGRPLEDIIDRFRALLGPKT